MRSCSSIWTRLPQNDLLPRLEQFTFRDFSRGVEMAQLPYEHTLVELEAWIARNGRPWESSVEPAAASQGYMNQKS